MKPTRTTNPRQARLHFPDGRVEPFKDQKLAYAVWLALPPGTRAASFGVHSPSRGCRTRPPIANARGNTHSDE